MKLARRFSIVALAVVVLSNFLPAFAQNHPRLLWQGKTSQCDIDSEDFDADAELALKAALLVTKGKEKQLMIMQALCDLYHEQRRFEDERDMILSWIKLAQESDIYSSVKLAAQHLRLSYALFLLKDFKSAESMANIALQLFRTSCGDGSTNVALALNNLAWIQMKLEKFSDAETNALQALAILKQVTGDKSLIYGLVVENLATLYSQMENEKLALHFYRLSFKILRNFFNRDDSILRELGKHIEEEKIALEHKASRHLAQKKGIRKKLAGKEHLQNEGKKNEH